MMSGTFNTNFPDHERTDLWLESRQQKSPAKKSGEAALLLGVLEQALSDLSKPRQCCDALRWIQDDEASDVTSFNHVCYILGFSETKIRKAVVENLSKYQKGWLTLKAHSKRKG